MKKILQFTAIAISLFIAACGAPTKEEAIDYNDELVADQKEILALEDNLIGSIVDWKYENAKSDLAVYQSKINEYHTKYEDMKSFDKEDEFRLAMIDLLKALKEQAEGNYPEVIEYIPLSETIDDLEDEPLMQLLDILDEIDLNSDSANGQFLDAQKKFADKYELQLQ